MTVVVCIGSSCHIRGSRQIVQRLQELIAQYRLGDKVELKGSFCMGQCRQGICVSVDDTLFSLTPYTVDRFFREEFLAKVG